MGKDGVALYAVRDRGFNLTVDLRAFCHCVFIDGMIRRAAADDVMRGFCCWLIFDGVISAGSNGVRLLFVKVFN